MWDNERGYGPLAEVVGALVEVVTCTISDGPGQMIKSIGLFGRETKHFILKPTMD